MGEYYKIDFLLFFETYGNQIPLPSIIIDEILLPYIEENKNHHPNNYKTLLNEFWIDEDEEEEEKEISRYKNYV